MEFTKRLYQQAKHIWDASHTHPFVTGIGDGSLDVEKFRFYIRQDYVFLIHYSKLFAMASIKSSTVQMAGKFADILQSTLNVEMDLHRQYSLQFDVSTKELERTEPAPITLAYTNYMLNAAHEGDLSELVVALLPCMWGYSQIGTRLKEENSLPEDFLYREWIEMYASEEFTALTQWLIQTMDALAEGLPERVLTRLEEVFITASRFEYMFWDMSYHMSSWPV